MIEGHAADRELEGLRRTLVGLVRDPMQRDLTLRQLGVLLVLTSEPGPHTVRALADQLGILNAAVTRALDVLEQARLVQRTPDPVERRGVRAEATPLGAALVRRLTVGAPPPEAGVPREN